MLVYDLIELLSKEDPFKEVIFDITRGDSIMGEFVSVDGFCFVKDPNNDEHLCLFSDLLLNEKPSYDNLN